MTEEQTHHQRLLQRLKQAGQSLGFNPLEVEQGSYEWHKMRLGVITASKAKHVVAKAGSATRRTYMAELVAEIMTGAPLEQISSKAIEWGRENEGPAIETYSFITGRHVERLPFIYSEDMRCGCSPDGIDDLGGVEIKAPFNTTNHILSIVDGRVKDEYVWQIQFSLWVSGLDSWSFASYDPRMRSNNLHIIECEPSSKHQDKLSECVPEFIKELDEMLEIVQSGPTSSQEAKELPF